MDATIGVLVSTAAANAGIDQSMTQQVNRIGFTRAILTTLQELGQNCCQPGMTGAYYIHADRKRFIKLLLSIVLPQKNEVHDQKLLNGIV